MVVAWLIGFVTFSSLSGQLATVTTNATVLCVHPAPTPSTNQTITFNSTFTTPGASLGIEGLRR